MLIRHLPYLATPDKMARFGVTLSETLVPEVEINQLELQSSYKQMVSNLEAKLQVVTMSSP